MLLVVSAQEEEKQEKPLFSPNISLSSFCSVSFCKSSNDITCVFVTVLFLSKYLFLI